MGNQGTFKNGKVTSALEINICANSVKQLSVRYNNYNPAKSNLSDIQPATKYNN